jgi:hypothetical protein
LDTELTDGTVSGYNFDDLIEWATYIRWR